MAEMLPEAFGVVHTTCLALHGTPVSHRFQIIIDAMMRGEPAADVHNPKQMRRNDGKRSG